MFKTLFEQFIGTSGDCEVKSYNKLGNTVYVITDSDSLVSCEVMLNTSFQYSYETIVQLIHTDLVKILEISFYH